MLQLLLKYHAHKISAMSLSLECKVFMYNLRSLLKIAFKVHQQRKVLHLLLLCFRILQIVFLKKCKHKKGSLLLHHDGIVYSSLKKHQSSIVFDANLVNVWPFKHTHSFLPLRQNEQLHHQHHYHHHHLRQSWTKLFFKIRRTGEKCYQLQSNDWNGVSVRKWTKHRNSGFEASQLRTDHFGG